MSAYNRIHNSSNPNQGDAKRVLALCSAGLLRSPTTAWVLSNPPYNYNTRSAGVNLDYALIPVDEVLLAWAQEIICVEPSVRSQLEDYIQDHGIDTGSTPVITLKIPDRFQRMHPKLIAEITKQYDAAISAILTKT